MMATTIKIKNHFLTFLILFLGMQGTISAQNLLNNPGFENNTSGWSSNTSTIASSSTSYTGKTSALVINRDTNTAGPGQNITSALRNSGKGKYNLQAYFKLANGTGTGRVTVTFYDDTGRNYYSISNSIDANNFNKVSGDINLNWSGSLYFAQIHVETGRETTTTMFVDDVALSPVSPERPSDTTIYYYQSHLPAPKLLSGAILEPRPTYFFISNNSQYKKVNFYCCKGRAGNAKSEPHDPAISDLTAPFSFTRNAADMASGIRELYIDAFPTTGGVESHAVNFRIIENITTASKNTPPVITGTPTQRVTQNSPYYFQPSVKDAENNTLTFSISGQPGWAIFDTKTGRLSGIPVKGETGNYNNIVISVSDGKDTTSLPAFNIRVEPIATSEEKAHIKVYYSYNSNLSNAKLLEGAVLQARQTYFFVTKTNQYKKVVFYCCKGFTANAAREAHLPAITDNSAPYSFTLNTSNMASGIRELYIDSFPTTGGVENHKVYFNLTTTPSHTPSQQSSNSALKISGSPSKRITEGSTYYFQPTITNKDNGALTFSISARPGWAIFNNQTGRLSGTPATGQSGKYNNIIISVTDGKSTTRLPAFSIQVEPVTTFAQSTVKTTTTAFYSYQSDLSNPQSLDGAVLEPRQTYFFITDNGQYKATTFYCCKGISGNAAGESHSPSVVDTTSPYHFSQNTTGMASGTRELYFDTFPKTGGIENHSVNFSVKGDPSQTGSFTVRWTAPNARADGSTLSLSEIAGYTVHYGHSKGKYSSHIKVNDHSAISKVINNIPTGTYYVAVTTRDSNGRESDYSKEVVIKAK